MKQSVAATFHLTATKETPIGNDHTPSLKVDMHETRITCYQPHKAMNFIRRLGLP